MSSWYLPKNISGYEKGRLNFLVLLVYVANFHDICTKFEADPDFCVMDPPVD